MQTSPANTTNHKSLTILMIDDESSCHMSMDLLLHGTNHTLIKAEGGSAGKAYVASHYAKD